MSLPGEDAPVTTANAKRIQGKPVSTTAPTDGQVLAFNNATWKPTSILDGAGAAEGTAQTIGAQTQPLLSFTPSDQKVATARVRVTGRKEGVALSASFDVMARFRRAGAIVTQEGSTTFVAWERDEVVSVSFTIAGTAVTANAVGVAGSTWNFYATLNLIGA